MKIAICDDSAVDRDYTAGMVEAWARDREILLILRKFPSAEAFLFQYAEEKDWDILLLDIEMGALDGVSMAKSVRKENEAVQIVFLTGYSDYIAEGYEVAALHYLMKPVSREKFFSVLDRAAAQLQQNQRCLNLELSGARDFDERFVDAMFFDEWEGLDG